MKINRIKNCTDFFKVVDSCKGRVELVTGEGDRLNLKSKLSQYVSFVEALNSNDIVTDMELVCSEPEDVKKMLTYMMGL